MTRILRLLPVLALGALVVAAPAVEAKPGIGNGNTKNVSTLDLGSSR